MFTFLKFSFIQLCDFLLLLIMKNKEKSFLKIQKYLQKVIFDFLCKFFYSGSSDVLQKRLKMYTKKQHLKESNVTKKDNSNKNTKTTAIIPTTPLMSTKKYTDFYIVIDFEATCEEPNPPGYFHEIIEFPAVLVDAQTLEIVRMVLLFFSFHFSLRLE